MEKKKQQQQHHQNTDAKHDGNWAPTWLLEEPEALNTFELSLAPHVTASLRSGFAVSLKDAGTRCGGGGGGFGERSGDLVFMRHLKHAEWTRR